MNSEHDPQDIPEVLPLPLNKHRQICHHCGSKDIAHDLVLRLTSGKVGHVGVEYLAGPGMLGFHLTGEELLHVNVCSDCCTVTRLFIKNTDHDWVKGTRPQ